MERISKARNQDDFDKDSVVKTTKLIELLQRKGPRKIRMGIAVIAQLEKEVKAKSEEEDEEEKCNMTSLDPLAGSVLNRKAKLYKYALDEELETYKDMDEILKTAGCHCSLIDEIRDKKEEECLLP